MASLPKNAPLRPVTPQQAQSSNPRNIPAPGQLLPVQTAGARPLSNVGPLSPVNQNGSFAFDRVIKSGKVNRRVKKKGAWKSSWKPAYLVLRPNLLSVYKDKDESELKASITLSDVTAVAPVKKSRHENVFGIFSPIKNYHFSGLSAREASDWITMIRLEARTEEQDDLQPPSAGFTQPDHQGYETTDLSADDEPVQSGSPEVPRWAVRGQKSRVAPQANIDARRTSGLAPYSGTEAFTTSQSDFSDGLGSSVPSNKGHLSASVPIQPSPLTPIPDDMPCDSRPTIHRGASYLSDIGVTPFPTMSKSTPKPAAQRPQSQDPSRIIRQGNLRLLKTVSGVKQWKSIWMVLRSQTLAMYKSSNEYTPVLIIPTYSIIEAAEIDRKNRQNCFQVIGEEKTYRLQAESENELESWLGAFKSVLVKQEAERGSRHASVSTVSALQGQGELQGVIGGRQGLGSRDGVSTTSAQMRNVSVGDQMVPGARRVMSPIHGMSAHAQVTSPT